MFSLAFCLPFAGCSSSSSTARPAVAAPRRGAPPGAGTAAAVPVVTARVEQKPMPVTLPAVGDGRGDRQRADPGAGDRPAERHSLRRRPGGREGTAAVQPRRAAVPGGAAAGRGGRWPATRRRCRTRRPSRRGSRTCSARAHLARPVRDASAPAPAALAATVEADKAAIENARLNVQYTEITAPISGRTGVARRPRRRPRPRQRHDAARRDQPVSPGLRDVLGAGPVPVRHPAVPGAEAAAGHGRRADGVGRRRSRGRQSAADRPPGQAPVRRVGRRQRGDASTLHRQRRGRDDRHDPPEGARSRTPTASCGRARSCRSTLDLTTDPDALVVPATAVQTSQDGQYVYVVKAGPDGRDAAGHGRAAAGRRGGDRQGVSRRRGRGDRRAAAPDAGRPRRRSAASGGAGAAAGPQRRRAGAPAAAAGSPRTRS